MMQPWNDLLPQKARDQLCRNLLIRADITKNAYACQNDPKAVRICERLGIARTRPVPRPGPMEKQRVLARASHYDALVRYHLQQRPDLIVVNLGAALDTRFSRLDNGRLRWYDVDLADIIHLRKTLLDTDERVRMLGQSVFDAAWPQLVAHEDTDALIFVAENFFPYQANRDIGLLLDRLARIFPGAVLYGDFVSKASWLDQKAGYLSFLKWETDLEKIGRLKVEQAWPAGALFQEKQPAWIRQLNRIPYWRDAVKIVKIRFKA